MRITPSYPMSRHAAKRPARLLLIFALLIGLTGCDSVEAGEEAPVDLNGAWSGSMAHPNFPGPITLNASHVGTQASGRWTWAWTSQSSGATGTTSGTFSGSVSEEGDIELAFEDAASKCIYLYAATLRGPNQVSGTFVADAATCRTPVQGTIDLSRN